MLAFFRRIVNSRVGIVVTFAVLVMIALAFGMGDITNLGNGLSGGGSTVATVGGAKVDAVEVRNAARNAVDAAHQQDPRADMAGFIAAGGFEATVERVINGRALAEFARKRGMRVGTKLIDGQIAGLPGFQGPDGRFSQAIYDRFLKQQRLSPATVRDTFALEIITSQLINPIGRNAQTPAQLALPYASLLLERREGQIGFVPTGAAPTGAAPSDAELQTWSKRNLTRFSLP